MTQAVLPSFIYFLLQFFVLIVGQLVVREKEMDLSDALKSWIFGQMLLFSVLQILAVPTIVAHLSFTALFWTYVCVCLVLFAFGCRCAIKKTWKFSFGIEKKEFTRLAHVLLILSFALILWHAGNYFFGMHLDEDDARWLVQANDALEYGDLMTRNFDTGEYLGGFMFMKDITSPFPMFYAVLSRLLFTRTPIFAHTVFAPFALLMMYAVYWLVAGELFENLEAKLTFLLCVAVINTFCARTGYEQAVFSLVRIWQGKAFVAGVIIPLLMYLFLCIHKRDETKDWLYVLLVSCAACHVSGMGILISAVMIGVYAAYDILVYQRWKRIPLAALGLLPPVAFYLLGELLKR